MPYVRPALFLGALALSTGAAQAQSTSGVFGPVVREGDRSAQYRLGLDPDSDAWIQRLHVQSAFNTTLRGRAIAQFEREPGQDADLDYVQAELLWQLTPDGQGYQTALRFDARVRPANRPELFRASWTNQYDLSEKVRLRGVIVTGAEFGDRAFDGISLETRGRVTYALDAGPEVGLEVFNRYGTTEDIRDLDDQIHQVGPYTAIDVSENWSMFAGLLFGATDASPDINFRLWLGRSF